MATHQSCLLFICLLFVCCCSCWAEERDGRGEADLGEGGHDGPLSELGEHGKEVHALGTSAEGQSVAWGRGG